MDGFRKQLSQHFQSMCITRNQIVQAIPVKRQPVKTFVQAIIIVSGIICLDNSKSTRHQSFRQFQLIDSLWKQLSGQFQLIRQSPRPFVRTIPINWKQQTPIVQKNPISGQSLKSIVRTIPIDSFQNRLSGQLQLLESFFFFFYLTFTFQLMDKLWSQVSSLLPVRAFSSHRA